MRYGKAGQINMQIPKLIHYAWFGGKPKPPLVQRCIDSWQRMCPFWEIREWNESNFDVTANAYTKAAYDAGKYAFVTDLVRLAVLYKYGGCYFDSDVEVLKPLDRFLQYRCFTGHEIPSLWVTAVMGAELGHPWIRMLGNYYNNAVYDGHTPNTQIITRLSQSWLEREAYGFKYLREGVVIFPEDTFCGFNHVELKPILTENSYAVHHFQGSWIVRTNK